MSAAVGTTAATLAGIVAEPTLADRCAALTSADSCAAPTLADRCAAPTLADRCASPAVADKCAAPTFADRVEPTTAASASASALAATTPAATAIGLVKSCPEFGTSEADSSNIDNHSQRAAFTSCAVLNCDSGGVSVMQSGSTTNVVGTSIHIPSWDPTLAASEALLESDSPARASSSRSSSSPATADRAVAVAAAATPAIVAAAAAATAGATAASAATAATVFTSASAPRYTQQLSFQPSLDTFRTESAASLRAYVPSLLPSRPVSRARSLEPEPLPRQQQLLVAKQPALHPSPLQPRQQPVRQRPQIIHSPLQSPQPMSPMPAAPFRSAEGRWSLTTSPFGSTAPSGSYPGAVSRPLGGRKSEVPWTRQAMWQQAMSPSVGVGPPLPSGSNQWPGGVVPSPQMSARFRTPAAR
ncbi:unnamed protein product [Polarella glacialis]|uniref:Uncharacterized protein n=1 Tax=Polarella glacialis TaxID=89957 RepID=A0A813H2A8_POLGL|nr:unnamed protein product [Polarella glacialis]